MLVRNEGQGSHDWISEFVGRNRQRIAPYGAQELADYAALDLFTAEFCEYGFDLLIAGEAAFRRVAQAAIDAGQFIRRRFVFTVLEAGVELKREFGKLVLDFGRPCLDAFQNLGQFLCLHGWECIMIANGCL
jgi:hypothetical protein